MFRKKTAVFLIAVVALLSITFCATAQTGEIFYRDTPTLQWDVPTTAPDGSPFIVGDTVRYDIYVWDTALGDIAAQPISSLELRESWVDVDPFVNFTDPVTLIEYEERPFTFSSRQIWAVGLTATHIDGGGNETAYDAIRYSTREADTKSGPFVYVPSSGLPSPDTGPADLRDSGM